MLFQCQTIDMVYPVDEGVNGLVPALDRICKEVSKISFFQSKSFVKTACVKFNTTGMLINTD